MSKPILITGATGNQGGAVLEALIKQGLDDFIVLALTRNASSAAAKRIATKSNAVHVLEGNMDDPQSIFDKAHELLKVPVWGVFMVQSVIAGGVTAAQEEAQGKKFINACIANSVKMFVYTSVDRGGNLASGRDPTPVSVFASKHRIEQHLFETAKTTDMSWCVLRPTGLIEPVLRNDIIAKMLFTSWKIYMPPDRTMQWVSCRDVGHFAAQAFAHPQQWSGKCLSLAGWEGTFAEANAIKKRVTGHDFSLTFSLLTRFVYGIVIKDLGSMYVWYKEKGMAADIKSLREMHPGLLGLEDCIREQTRTEKM